MFKSFTSTIYALTILSALYSGANAEHKQHHQVRDNGNSILNKDLNPEIFHYLGQYSPRYTVKDDSTNVPHGCHVEVVNSIERHGARYMTSSALTSANATLTKIQSALSKSQNISSDFAFLKNASLLTGTNDLVPYGALQAYYSGQSTAATYPSLTHVAPFVRGSGDLDTLDDRVILTARYWKLGFEGKPFPSGSFVNSADVRSAAQKIPNTDLNISEKDGQNNTLDVSTCTNFENVPSSKGEKGAQQSFAQTTILPIIGTRLQNKLIQSGAPQNFNLTGTDLINLATICSFETLGRASVQDGKLHLSQSPFCTLFNSTEWPILGYAFDVGKWKGVGYGSQYYKANGQGFLRELLARFTGKAPPLADPTSLNSTLDGNSKTFPLPSKHKGPLVYFDGSHDNNIGPIVAAASLFSGPDLTTDYNAQAKSHNWYFSQIAPLQGKVVFEKISCQPHKSEYVRIRANGAILDPKTYCGTSNSTDQHHGKHHKHHRKHYKHLCPLNKFVDQLAFVETDTEWNKCFS
jgi:Histidine phosphatase superfamily (branch 2)